MARMLAAISPKASTTVRRRCISPSASRACAKGEEAVALGSPTVNLNAQMPTGTPNRYSKRGRNTPPSARRPETTGMVI